MIVLVFQIFIAGAASFHRGVNLRLTKLSVVTVLE